MGVAALQEWCRRGLEGYRGVSITDMSSSWRDGLAFCALIHRYRPDLLDFDSLDQDDWTGNCTLAFQVAESHLGIPTLLDVEDVIKNESPDQFFIMTYVAQFYHRFTAPDSGYDSTLTTSFKYSSSEEESPRRIDSSGKRKAGSANLMEWKRRRPLGLVVSGGLELRIDSPQEERENPFKSDDSRNQENTLKTYDADDEEGESSEVVLRNIPGLATDARNGSSGHQDLVLKRKRPNSLNRVSSSSMDKENYCKAKDAKVKTEKRTTKRMLKPKGQETAAKRKVIGVSDFPKPYENKETTENDCHKYMTERRRKRSTDSAVYSNIYNQTSARLRDSHDPLIERVKQVPLHIAESQKLLKTSIFQLKSPQYPTKCLILNIYKIKYDKRQNNPPSVIYQNDGSEQFKIKQAENLENKLGLQDLNNRIPSTLSNTHFGRFDVQKTASPCNTITKTRQMPMQTNEYAQQAKHSRTERFKIKPQERLQSIKLDNVPENNTTHQPKHKAHQIDNTLEHFEIAPHISDTLLCTVDKQVKPHKELPYTSNSVHNSQQTAAEIHPQSYKISQTQKLERMTQTSEIPMTETKILVEKSMRTNETQTQTLETHRNELEVKAEVNQQETQTEARKTSKETNVKSTEIESIDSETCAAVTQKSEEKTPTPMEVDSATPFLDTLNHKTKNNHNKRSHDMIDYQEASLNIATKAKCETPKILRKGCPLSEFEKYNVQTPSTWKTEDFDNRSERLHIGTPKHSDFKSHTLTPRSRSKYEHLIKNLKESQDDNLVIYKVLETPVSKPSTQQVTPYKEPKDKYTIEYLWNIGATNFQPRRPTRKCH